MCRIETILVVAPVACSTVANGFPESSETVEVSDSVEDADNSDWQTVPAKRRGSKVKPGAGPVVAEAPAEADAWRCDGNAVDFLDYDRKELFHRGWQSGAKQPRSVKQKRKTEYQVNKRRDQSTHDRASMFAGEIEDDGDF